MKRIKNQIMNNNEVYNGKNKPLENAMDSLKESSYKVEKQKYNFMLKEDSDLSFKDVAKIVNKKYQNAFKYLKEH